MAADNLAIINLETSDAFVFQFFHAQEDSEHQANWEPQGTGRGTKPLMYANQEPDVTGPIEFWFDGSDNGQSVEQDIKELRALMQETETGVPPALRYIRGREQQRVVLQRMHVERQMFNRRGEAIRAKVSLTFMEHAQIERVTVRTTDPEDEAANFSPIGNF